MTRRTQLARSCGAALCIGFLAASCGTETTGDVVAPSTSNTSPASLVAAETAAAETLDATSSTSTTATTTPVETELATTSTMPASTIAPSNANCRRLTDFDDINDGWVIVNDGVMGGRSNGAIEFDNSSMRFTGSVVTDGGGFTSVRLRLDGSEFDGATRIETRVHVDARTYGVTFQDDAVAGRRPISHNGDLATTEPPDADGWTIVGVAFDQLRPSVFGQPLEAEPFDPDQASEIGIIIADGIDGDFTLIVDWIDACID